MRPHLFVLAGCVAISTLASCPKPQAPVNAVPPNDVVATPETTKASGNVVLPSGSPDANSAIGTFTVTTSDGLSSSMKIVSSINSGIAFKTNYYGDPDNKDVWWNLVHWSIPHAANVTGVAMPATTRNVCVQKVVAAMPTCGEKIWDENCVDTAKKVCTGAAEQPYLAVDYGNSICGNEPDGKPREAIFIGGEWDTSMGKQGAGGKIKGEESGAVTIACRRVGAVAKCIDFGYKPWASPELDELHQACVRMVRADFCGDGTTWTKDGNLIDIEDALGIMTPGRGFVFEATWTKDGASFMNINLSHRSPVWGEHMVNPIYGVTFAEYQKTHPYCNPRRVTTLTPKPGEVSLPETKVDRKRKDLMLRTHRQVECPASSTTCKLGL
jgi:hypothetical protein